MVYAVDPMGIAPDPEEAEATKEMVVPSAVPGACRFWVMVNYFGRFIPNIAMLSAPLRELLAKEKKWHSGQPQERAFACLKQLVSSARCDAKLDHTLCVVLSADVSSCGIGVVLLQVQQDWHKRAVAFISRALTPTEQRYAQIEKEALL